MTGTLRWVVSDDDTQMKYLISIFLTIVVSLIFISSWASVPGQTTKIYNVDISGEVGPSMAAYVERVFRDIPDEKDSIIIFDMDTFGGRVDSALLIVDAIVNSDKGKTIAFVSKKAISAGALIALSCNELFMRNNTTIGDCAPIMYTSEEPKALGEKFQSPLRAQFRSLAKKNGYSEALAESMVSEDLEVYRVVMEDEEVYMDSLEYEELTEDEKSRVLSKKTIVAEGELLTMDDAEAMEYGFSETSVASKEELLTALGIVQYEIIPMDRNWSEGFVGFIISITPILMLIGIAAIYTEIKSPGFGVPGIIGVICLGLVFLNQYIVGLADHTELLLIVLGFATLGFELFVIPGFGIAGVAGILLIAAGMILSLQGFVIPDPSLPWEAEILSKNVVIVLSSFIGAFLISMLIVRFILPKVSRVISGPYLDTTLEDSHADSKATMSVGPGQKGIAMTPLRPAGKMKIGDDIVDVVTEGEFLEKGMAVVITAIDGNRVVVNEED